MFVYIFFGFITGLIDSVVGGGGLISLPFLSLMLGAGPFSIGTNKINGVVGALVSLMVYKKHGHLKAKEGIWFCIICACGSYLGSSITPLLPVKYFKIVLLVMAPLILYLIWNKEFFFNKSNKEMKKKNYYFLLAGFVSGFYDGFFGPGGGTFMFLSLHFFTSYTILQSIAISKMANTFSAGTALINYSVSGYVNYREGIVMGLGMGIGAYLGAQNAVKNVDKIIRPMLVLVVFLLVLKLVFSS